MHRRILPLVALVLCAIFAAPAQANFRVGIADQNAAMYDNPKFQALKIKRIRYLVAYDWYKVACAGAAKRAASRAMGSNLRNAMPAPTGQIAGCCVKRA